MPELRQDPVTGRWVLIASNRADRPNEFSGPTPPRIAKTPCPFCAGQLCTPPPVAIYGSDDDWQLRVVPNLYPALTTAPAADVREDGFFRKSPAAGWHEVIIESPRHLKSLSELSASQSQLVFRAYRDRMLVMRQQGHVACALPFKNVGPAAGASLEHVHSQIVGLPMVPPVLLEELQGAQRHFQQHGDCVFCRMIREELAQQQRVVIANEHFVAFCPHASRFGYETWVLPRDHTACFDEIDDEHLVELGGLVKQLVSRLEDDCGVTSYNYLVHSAPFDRSRGDHYHWHIEIIPRVVQVAGFEWGTGININPVLPEQAAIQLRRNAFLRIYEEYSDQKN